MSNSRTDEGDQGATHGNYMLRGQVNYGKLAKCTHNASQICACRNDWPRGPAHEERRRIILPRLSKVGTHTVAFFGGHVVTARLRLQERLRPEWRPCARVRTLHEAAGQRTLAQVRTRRLKPKRFRNFRGPSGHTHGKCR